MSYPNAAAMSAKGDRAIYVLLARLCDNLGVTHNRQAERIQEHGVLSDGFIQLVIEEGLYG